MLSPNPAPVPQKSRVGGTLIFTGATSATRGAANFATFAAGKHGVRALSQSLAREFGKRDIHVAHVIIDGPILTDRIKQMFGGREKIGQTPGAEPDADVNWLEDESKRLDPTSIAKVQLIPRTLLLVLSGFHQNFIWLHLQDRSAWTLEVDLRPAKVRWLMRQADEY
jgi:NAD(P)-dependent dehydrogenase (short-subunit alcohol dehydrogenase family)